MDGVTTWRGLSRLAALVGVGLALASGACSLDFNEAVPCQTNEQCPEGFVCDLTAGRCATSSEPLPDTTPDPDTDDVAEDLPDDAGADPDIEDDAPDLAVDTTPDPTGDPDGGGDVCVPMEEVCNGLDDDCDTVPDNGIDCGTCPDAEGMVLIVRAGLAPFCVDLYEASRTDATIASPGTAEGETMATSQAAVLPWFDLTFEAASTACANASKRMCTAAEWTEACGGPEAWLYPYHANTYNPGLCNGVDTPDPDIVAHTTAFNMCVSPEGPLQMSGNLEEWVAGPSTRGGSFQDGTIQLRCSGEGETPAEPDTTVGFRCCADPS